MPPVRAISTSDLKLGPEVEMARGKVFFTPVCHVHYEFLSKPGQKGTYHISNSRFSWRKLWPRWRPGRRRRGGGAAARDQGGGWPSRGRCT